MKVEIYSDVACPWCYVGKTRFEHALDKFAGRQDVEVAYRPFQLSPDDARRGAAAVRVLRRRCSVPVSADNHDHVAELARREGLEFRFDRALVVNTFTAHRLLWLTERDYGASGPA